MSEKLLVLLGTILILPFLVLYSAFSWGFVATVLSGWFVIPLFPEFPQLSWIEFAGISLFISCFVIEPVNQIKDDCRVERPAILIEMYLRPWLLLLISWFIHLIY